MRIYLVSKGLSIIVLPLTILSAQSQTQGSSGAKPLTSSQIHSYMRKPGGLEKLSALTGDVTFSETDERWGQSDLRSLARDSDVIVNAVVENAETKLADDGDSVLTEYKLRVARLLKGDASEIVYLIAVGGRVKLANGHYATYNTPVSQSVQEGQSFIFFLRRVEGKYSLVASTQGLLGISANNATLHLIEQNPLFDSDLRGDLDGLSVAEGEAKIRNAVPR